jgi:hypothetical protein
LCDDVVAHHVTGATSVSTERSPYLDVQYCSTRHVALLLRISRSLKGRLARMTEFFLPRSCQPEGPTSVTSFSIAPPSSDTFTPKRTNHLSFLSSLFSSLTCLALYWREAFRTVFVSHSFLTSHPLHLLLLRPDDHLTYRRETLDHHHAAGCIAIQSACCPHKCPSRSCYRDPAGQAS